MPVDTSIALGVRPPQFQTIDPMTIYSAMENQRINALREQALQQDMQRNALIMQNTMEDRRAAAAKAARDLREQQEMLRVLQGGRIPARDVVMGPGTIQASTPAGYDFEGVKNKMLERGSLSGYEALSKAQEQEANRLKAQLAARNEGFTGVKTQTETEGLRLKNIDTQLAQVASSIDRAPTMEAVYSIYSAVPDALAVRGQTPETAIQAFNAHVAELSKTMPPNEAFAQARRDVANGAMATQKQLSEIATAQKPEIMTDANGNLISANAYTATATPFTMAAPAGAPAAGAPAAGAPAAGAPAAAGEPVKATPKGGLTENQKMRLRATTSEDFGAATETLRYIQDVQRDIESLKDVNIGGATGYQSYLPSFNEDTILAEKTLKELEGKLSALGRTLATMSGKLGNLAVQEYEFLRQQVGLIDPTAGKKDVRRQLDKINTGMKRLTNTVRDRYSREYGGEDNPFPQFRELPEEVGADAKTGAAAGVSTGDPEIDALFNKYGK